MSQYKNVFREINENNTEIIFDAQSLAGELEGSRWGKWGGYAGPSNDIDNAVALGQAQQPGLDDYADGIDTLKFLLEL